MSTAATNSPPVLELRDVHRLFPSQAGLVRAVDGVSLSLARGETLGLVGESGCGKSTLGRLSLGLDQTTSGQVLVDGTDLTTLRREPLRLLRRTMQMVFQDPVASLNPRLTVADAIAEPLRELGVASRAEAEKQVRELLELVGLSPTVAWRHPSQLSGGQAQRVAIARAIGPRPSLVVADEAVSSLDVSVAAQILNLLDDLRAEMGISYLFISHDLAVVEHVSDRVAVMYLGKVVELGRAADVFAQPQHPYTVALLSATPSPTPGRARRRERIVLKGDPPSPVDPPSGCRFRARCPIGPLVNPERTVCAEREPALAEARRGQQAACHFAGDLAGKRQAIQQERET